MQLSPEGTYSSAPDCAIQLAKEGGGVGLLFAGADIITIGFFLQGAVSFALTEYLRRFLMFSFGGEGGVESFGASNYIVTLLASSPHRPDRHTISPLTTSRLRYPLPFPSLPFSLSFSPCCVCDRTRRPLARGLSSSRLNPCGDACDVRFGAFRVSEGTRSEQQRR